MQKLRAEQVINGTFGELWFDGEYLANITAFKAEVTIKTTGVAQVGSLVEGQKITGLEYKGEMKTHKVNSFVAKKVSDAIKAGKTPKFTIISNLDDPDAAGAERIACYDCLLDKIILADWENAKLGEESYGFTFEDYEYLSQI